VLGARREGPGASLLATERLRRARPVDIEIQAKEITRYRRLLEELIAFHTGQPLERVAKDTDRDFILTAEGAVEYGVVDEVITSRKITPELAAVGGGGSLRTE
jgi:ATP-dependent protease ClpP protease subunit